MPVTKQAAKIHIFMVQKTFFYSIIYQQITNRFVTFSRKLMRKNEQKALTD